MPKWREIVVEAMKKLGGKATLQQLYDEVPKIDKEKGYGKLATNRHYEAKIRQTVQLNDCFYQRKKGSGVWCLRKTKQTMEVV